MIPLIKKKTIYLTEIFKSIQGETSLSGLPTIFIRASGCNLRCTWCDTTYSFSRGTPYEIDEILKIVEEFKIKNICITGGEPLLQEAIYELMTLLCNKKYIVSLETGGSLSINKVDSRVISIVDVKCPGSGMDKKNFLQNLVFLRPHDEVKFVIKDREDYDFAINICKKYGLFERNKPVLFSPVYQDMCSQTLISWILEDSFPIRLNLQIHKFIWHPTTRGV